MSAEPGYLLIRVDLQGAQQAAAEAAALRGEIAGTAASTQAASTAATPATSKTRKYANAWSALGKAAKFAMFGVGAGMAAIGYAGIKSTERIKDLGLVAAGLRRNLDLTAEAGSRWAAVAESRGIAPTSLNMGFKTLSQNLVMAHKEGGTYMDNLQMIGITHDDVKKGMGDFDWFIKRVADRFGEMTGSAKRQTAAAKLLGRGYQTILPLFSQSSKGLQEQLQWADKYNIAMGDKMVDTTVELAMAQRESKVAWLGIQNMLAKEFMPTIIDVHDEFQAFAAQITDPKLTRDQKIDLIGRKFQKLATMATDIFISVLPGAIEQASESAVKIAGAFIKGFVQAEGWAKFVLGIWLLNKLTKGALITAVLTGGAKLGMKLGQAIVAKVVLWMIGAGVADSLIGTFGKGGKVVTKMTPVMRAAGGILGRAFGLGLVTLGAYVLWTERDKFYDVAKRIAEDISNIISAGPESISPGPGTMTPHGGQTGETVTIFGDYEVLASSLTPYRLQSIAEETGHSVAEVKAALRRAGVDVPGIGGDGGDGGGNKRGGGLPRGERVAVGGGGQGKVGDENVNISVNIDGKQVAQAVHRRSQDKKARK